ncbi:hypothetical protein ABBQ38_013586 [Trebouxia sp. C0009 RCD-2024]
MPSTAKSIKEGLQFAPCRAWHIHVTAYSPLGSPDSASMFKRKAQLLMMQDPTVNSYCRQTVLQPYSDHMYVMSWASALTSSAGLRRRCGQW